MKEKIFIIASTILLVIAVVIAVIATVPKARVGGTSIGSEYTGTTTQVNIFGANTLLVDGPGTFGGVILTGAAAGVMTFVDATTTNINLRTGNKATSTITIATFPASTAAGQYLFDVNFSTGLLVSVSGTMPTSTITYRQR